MSWPSSTDYNRAIQHPAVCFGDPELKQGQATGMMGLPQPYAGNFADVYQLDCPDNQSWAVKCFTREVTDLRQRYQAISQHLERENRRFTVPFQYLEEGIRVRDQWYPIVKMRWIEGLTLNELVREHVGNAPLLERLGQLWLRLADEMRDAHLAHGDLQHGNVLLVPRDGGLLLRLIDYDGMWVPELADAPPGEVGHPDYQHPERLARGGYFPEVDRFSLLVIYTAVRALVLGGPDVWSRHDNGDNLLFRKADFEAPGRSKLFAELLYHSDPELRALSARLLLASRSPLAHVPYLADLLAHQNTSEDLLRARALVPPPTNEGGEQPIVGTFASPALPEQQAKKSKPDGEGRVKAPATRIASGPGGSTTNGRRRSRLKSRTTLPATAAFALVPALPSPLKTDRPPEAIPLGAADVRASALSGKPIPAAVLVAPQAILAPVPIPLPMTATLEPLATETLPEVLPVPAEDRRPQTVRKGPRQAAGPRPIALDVPALLAWWPLALGVVLLTLSGLALVAWLAFRRSDPKPHPPPPALARPQLQPLSALEIKGGHKLSVAIAVERHGSPAELTVRLNDLPSGIAQEAAVLTAEDSHARIALRASPQVPQGTHTVRVTLWEGAHKLAEQSVSLRVRELVLPKMLPVTPLTVQAGARATLAVRFNRRGNNDPVTLRLDKDLPAGLQQEPSTPPLPPGTAALEIVAAPSAEEGPRWVLVLLMAGELEAQREWVKVEVTRPRPKVRFEVEANWRLTLKQGGTRDLSVPLQRGKFAGPVQLELKGHPTGVTYVPAPSAPGTEVLRMTAGAGAAVGTYTVKVAALVGGTPAGEASLTLTVEKAAAMEVAPAPMPADGAPKELVGTWVLVGTMRNGAPVRPAIRSREHLVITKDRWACWVNGRKTAEYSIKADPGTKPARLQLTGVAFPLGIRGIYTIRNDTLTWGYPPFPVPGEVPTTFADRRLTILRYQRERR